MRIILVGALPFNSAAIAADMQFPVKPIRMVVPFGAGSNSDLLARTVAVRMSEHWGQQVVVDNRPGAGGTIHLSAELLKSMTGITMEHIAYKSSPLAHIDMISGQVHAMFDAMPTALPQVKAGRLRAVAVTTAKRSPQMPDLPTIAEAGVPGFEAAGWFGFAAPARTPKDVVGKLNKEIVRILALPDVKERLISQGAEPVGDTPEQFAQYIKAEAAKWGKVIKSLNLKIE